MWLWRDHEKARGKFSVTAACAFGAIPRLRGPPHSYSFILMWHQGTYSRFPDAFAPHHVLTHLKVAEQPFQRVRPAGPLLGKSLSIRLPSRPSWRAASQLLAESFQLLPLVGCRTRLLRAWPHEFLWARRCPPAKHTLGCWVFCVQCRCKCVVSCCCLCAPSSFLIRAWDQQWRSCLFLLRLCNVF